MIRITIALLFALLASGCSNAYTLTRAAKDKPLRVLSRAGSVYVSQPANGRYEEAEYRVSGAATAQAVAAAFAPYASRVEKAENTESFDATMARCRGGSFAYLVEPTILHWEDRNTEWSGKSDIVIVRIVVYDVPSRQPIDSVTIDGKSKWATLGGDHPQHLLPKPLADYAAQMYGGPAAVPTKQSDVPD